MTGGSDAPGKEKRALFHPFLGPDFPASRLHPRLLQRINQHQRAARIET